MCNKALWRRGEAPIGRSTVRRPYAQNAPFVTGVHIDPSGHVSKGRKEMTIGTLGTHITHVVRWQAHKDRHPQQSQCLYGG